MLDLQGIFYWLGTIVGLIVFVMLSIRFIKRIKDSSTKFEKYRAVIYWALITIALLATVFNSLIITCVGVIVDVAMVSYLYQKKNEINNNRKYGLRVHEDRFRE